MELELGTDGVVVTSRRTPRAMLAVVALIGMAGAVTCRPVAVEPGRAAPAATAVSQGSHNPPADHTKDRKGVRHKSGSKQALQNCGPCHGPELRGGVGPSCYACHGKEWR